MSGDVEFLYPIMLNTDLRDWIKRIEQVRKLKSMSLIPWVALAVAVAIAAPGTAGTREGYDLWQKGDFFGAVREWRTAAVAGDPIAQFNLARAYQLGRGVPLDLKMAESWFGKAAMQGHKPSRDNYGLALFQNGDRDTAMPYIEDAAKRGDPRAQYVLGTALFNGDTLKKDWVRAYAMMTRASAAGISAASASLAQMDSFIPMDQRQRGLVMARTIEASAAKTQQADAMIGDTAVPAPRPAVMTESLPPSPVGAPPISATKPAVKPAKPASAPKPPVVAKVTAPVAKPEKPTAKPAAAVAGNWKVQLGAFSEAANARTAWAALQKRVGALGPYKASFAAAGKMTRLQAGPLPSRTAAETLCVSLKAASQPCFPVAP